MLTNKQRVHAVLAGQPVDRAPVTASYNYLYHEDHFAELTGLPQWRMHQWLAEEPAVHAATFAQLHAQASFELLQPMHYTPPRAWRARQAFVERDGIPFRHDTATDEWVRLDVPTTSGHASDYHANETQYVFDQADINARVQIVPAEEQLAEGRNDYIDAVTARFGAEEFILAGGVVGPVYLSGHHVGQTNLFAMMLEAPALIDHLCARVTEQNIEAIRCYAAAGGDAIYIDDATATSDMIAPALYERFSLPYMRAMVAEIHRLGHKAIVIYFGGIMDRLEQIAATSADGLAYEASMKGFINDTAEIARRIGDRMTLFSNIDPIAVLQDGSDADLEAEIIRQLAAARPARGFILSTGSPITPYTPLTRVQRFLAAGKRLSANPSSE